ncbi:MAG: IreB family regulatory phosphoprotein [Clostridia bacterium]|nr:IreB family regulatory phosphoprotein [Clostridia bacterium]
MTQKNENTITFTVDQEAEIRDVVTKVYQALSEKGYNPLNQLVGYILTEDPTYITNHSNARALIRKIDRDALLNALLRHYLGV